MELPPAAPEKPNPAFAVASSIGIGALVLFAGSFGLEPEGFFPQVPADGSWPWGAWLTIGAAILASPWAFRAARPGAALARCTLGTPGLALGACLIWIYAYGVQWEMNLPSEIAGSEEYPVGEDFGLLLARAGAPLGVGVAFGILLARRIGLRREGSLEALDRIRLDAGLWTTSIGVIGVLHALACDDWIGMRTFFEPGTFVESGNWSALRLASAVVGTLAAADGALRALPAAKRSKERRVFLERIRRGEEKGWTIARIESDADRALPLFLSGGSGNALLARVPAEPYRGPSVGVARV